MKKILLLFILSASIACKGQNYPLWSTPKDSVDLWISQLQSSIIDSLHGKMDTGMAMQMASIMRQAISDSAWRQHYNDTDTYDLTRAKALEWFFTKMQTDGRYLQSFSESDPIYNSNGQKYSDTVTNGYDLTKYQADIWYPRKSTLGLTAYSNSYTDLLNKPTIPTTLPPSGSASGDLTGTYPAPSIANNAVTSTKILDGTIVNTDISASAGIDYSKLANTPTIPTNTNQLTNGAGFLTGVTGSQVTTALGYTPYNGATNPNGYISTSAVTLRNKTGLVSNSVVLFADTFSVSTASPTIDLSAYMTAAGKSNCKILSAVGYRVGAISSNSPNVTITGITSNSVSLIFNQTNTATVSILSINVLSGLPTILTPDPTNVKVLLTAYFY